MKIAIYSRTTGDVEGSNLQRLLDELFLNKIEAIIFQPFYELVRPVLKVSGEVSTFSTALDLGSDIDFLISMGGDGTLLDTVCFVRDKNIPIIGINFGRLGFLASFGKDDVVTLVNALISRTFQIEQRGLIHLDSNVPLFGEVPYALNEFTIHKKDTSAMIKIHTFLNGEFINTYWADGLIVSTPTGYTGYSLSCGGPVVFPDADCFIITPVAPHNLNVRPLLVKDQHVISFEIEGRGDQFLCTLDSRMESVNRNIELAVRKESFTLSLLRLPDSNFLQTLRNKLLWGIDKRN